jgi:hypothetical protein
MDIRKIDYLFRMEFDVNETIKVLTHNKTIYFCWGVSKLYNCENKGLLLKVKGHHFKDYVLITLGWDDLYNVHYLNEELVEVEKIEGVYFDMLVDIIDERIEKI